MKRCLLTLTCTLAALSGCTPTQAASPQREQAAAREQAEEHDAQRPKEEGYARASAGIVSAEFIAQHGLILASERPQEIHALLRLSAEQPDDQALRERPALNLAIVLDRSGSMAGDNLRFAKQAGLDLLNRLEERDRVTLISYDDEVRTHSTMLKADRAGVERLRAQLLGLQAGDTTALGPALFTALDGLRAEPDQDSLDHIILLSDGRANEGETRPDIIGQRAAAGFQDGISVSSLGMGLGYNEDLMTAIADQGGGRYHFIENAEQVPSALTEEFAGLVNTVASGVSLEFSLASGVELLEVHGYVSSSLESRTQIRVGSLSAGQSRDIIVRLRVNPAALTADTDGAKIDIGALKIRYQPVDPPDAAPAEFELEALLALTHSEDDLRGSERTEVTVRVAEVQAAAEIQAASVAVDRGDFDQAHDILAAAQSELERQKIEAESEELAAEIDAQLSELSEAKDSIDGAREDASAQKSYSKRYKAKSYAKGKGSKKKSYAKSKKSKMNLGDPSAGGSQDKKSTNK